MFFVFLFFFNSIIVGSYDNTGLAFKDKQFFNFLDEKYDEEEVIELNCEDKEVQKYFNSHIEKFKNHINCPKNCLGYAKSDTFRNLVVSYKIEKEFDSFKVDETGEHIIEKKKYAFVKIPAIDEIIDGKTVFQETRKFFFVDEIYNTYFCPNQMIEKQFWILDERYPDHSRKFIYDSYFVVEEENFDHSKCNKQKCINEGKKQGEEGYDCNKPCHLIQLCKKDKDEIKFIIEYAAGVCLGSFQDSAFLEFFSVEGDRITLNLKKLKEKIHYIPKKKEKEIENLSYLNKKLRLKEILIILDEKNLPGDTNFLKCINNKNENHLLWQFVKINFNNKKAMLFGSVITTSRIIFPFLFSKNQDYSGFKNKLILVTKGFGLGTFTYLGKITYDHTKKINKYREFYLPAKEFKKSCQELL